MQTKDSDKFQFIGALTDMSRNSASDDDDGFCPSNRPAVTVACCSAGLV